MVVSCPWDAGQPRHTPGPTPGTDPDRETLQRAAAIAAYHSKARIAGVVAVSGTRVRDVSKPRGAKAGTVQIRHERVFKVRPARGDLAGESGHASASPLWRAASETVRRHGVFRQRHDCALVAGAALAVRGSVPLQWIASEQSLVREAKGGGRAITNHDMIDEGNAQQLPRVHEPLREGTIFPAGRGVA